MRPSTIGAALLLLALPFATANTEKVIFTGPASRAVPLAAPSLEELQLPELSPEDWSLRTHLPAAFPTGSAKYGTSSWVLLRGLQERQRYEVRICWAATEPTSFRLDTYQLPVVLETPDLITSLAQYSEERQPDFVVENQKPRIVTPLSSKNADEAEASALFLHIQAAADYYTMDRALMENVPPVFVDIILDPYLFNILPRSLVPTFAYIILLAIGSWYLSKYISRRIQDLSRDVETEKKKA